MANQPEEKATSPEPQTEKSNDASEDLFSDGAEQTDAGNHQPPDENSEQLDARDEAALEIVSELEADSSDADSSDSLPAQLEEAQQRVLRLQAEMENFRKRTHRSMDEERKYSCLPLLRDLLTVVDNMERAIASAEKDQNTAGLLEGVKMVAEQLTGVLQQHHCQMIEAEGAVFDPHLHEAIAQLPSESHEPGTVTQVTQVGYQLHDRVVRPSQVIVAAEQAAPESTES